MVELKQIIVTHRARLDNGRRKAEVAEKRTSELELLNATKARQIEQLEERLRLTRQMASALRYLVPVLTKMRDANARLKLLGAKAEEAEAKTGTLNARIEELETRYMEVRRTSKELDELISELSI